MMEKEPSKKRTQKEKFVIERMHEALDPRRAEKIVNVVFSDIEKNRNDLGEGMTSKVFTAGGDEFCVKRIEIEEADIKTVGGNTIEVEFDFQERVYNLGVRTPMPLVVFRTAKNERFFVMETIFGNNLKELLKNPSKTPPGFDANKNKEKLKSFLELLENNDFNHGDLKSRNVMIDENGELVLIDWGLASSKKDAISKYEDRERRRKAGEIVGVGRRLDSRQFTEISKNLDRLAKKLYS